MATNKMFTVVLQSVLEKFKEMEDDSQLPKKFSMKAITNEINMIVKSLKDEKIDNKKKKGTGKKSVYNLYVKDNMEIVKDEFPDMTNSERMKEIARRWQEYKEKNPNYNELYAEKLIEANGKIDYVKSDDSEDKEDDE